MTLIEQQRLVQIKNLTLARCGHRISARDRQWVLDIYRREGWAMPAATLAQASNAGYNSQGIRAI